MACLICHNDHAADAACQTLVRSGTGTAVFFQEAPAAVADVRGGTLVRAPSPAPGAAAEAPAAPADPLIGTTIGSFKLIGNLGRGGMGTVYLGEQTVIGSRVAVKILHEHLASNAGLVSRFYAEARAVNLIGHDNIVNIFDMNVVPPNRYYLIMEYLEGKTLSELVRGPLRAGVALPILIQVCDALQAAHAHGVVHRDLKPENIFLIRRGKQEHFVKILDFGIAKLFATEVGAEQTAAGMIIGTPEYMAPEQCTGDPVDGRADVYSLGIMAYLMATGRLPFEGGGLTGLLIAHREKVPPAPHLVNPDVSLPWSLAIMRAIAKRPQDRFPDADAFRAALELAEERDAPTPTPVPRVVPQGPAPVPIETRTPKPLDSRYLATFNARLLDTAGRDLTQLRCLDVSRGGMFLCSDTWLPKLFTRLRAVVELPGGEVDCAVEVVRQVSPEQAQAWGMSAGFGVQFVDPPPDFRERIERALAGLPGAPPPIAAQPDREDDPITEAFLREARKRIEGDHYVVLSLPQDAEVSHVRRRGRELVRESEDLERRALSLRQRIQLKAVTERVAASVAVLGTAEKRAVYDGNRGNYRGVARCLAAGLTAAGLERLRADHLTAHRGAEASGQIHAATATSWEGRGELDRALEEYERALRYDPLNLPLHQRFWALKRRSGTPAPQR